MVSSLWGWTTVTACQHAVASNSSTSCNNVNGAELAKQSQRRRTNGAEPPVSSSVDYCWNRWALRWRLKEHRVVSGVLRLAGRLFHVRGPLTVKLRWPIAVNCAALETALHSLHCTWLALPSLPSCFVSSLTWACFRPGEVDITRGFHLRTVCVEHRGHSLGKCGVIKFYTQLSLWTD